MKKKLALLLTVILTTILFALPVSAQQPIKILIDGKELKVDVSPVIKEGTTLMPLRAIFQELGAEVNWDKETQTIKAVKDMTTIILTIDQKEATVNEKRVELSVPAQIINGSTLVPGRFIAESLGAIVDWDSTLQQVIISRELPLPLSDLTEDQALEKLAKAFENTDKDVKYLKYTPDDNYLMDHPEKAQYYIFSYQTEYYMVDYNYCVDKTTGDIYIGSPAENLEDGDGAASIIPYNEWIAKYEVQ